MSTRGPLPLIPRSEITMLDFAQRYDRYLAQTGRNELTPRQLRRLRHKDGHQSAYAMVTRAERSQARTVKRKARLSGLLAP